MSKRISRIDSRRLKRAGQRRAFRLLSPHTHEWTSASIGGQDSSSRQNCHITNHSISSSNSNTYVSVNSCTHHKHIKAKHICKLYLEAVEHHLDSDFLGEEWQWTPDCGIAPNITVKCGSFNIRGATQGPKRAIVDAWAHSQDLACMGLQETKRNSNSKLVSEHYIWFFSSSVTSEARTHIDDLRSSNKKIDQLSKVAAQEQLGVGIMIQKKFLFSVKRVRAISNRILVCSFKGTPDWYIIAAYAPHAGHSDLVKNLFWFKLILIWKEHKAEEFRIILGDFNNKLLERPDGLHHAIGTNILPHPSLSWSDISEYVVDNRCGLRPVGCQHMF